MKARTGSCALTAVPILQTFEVWLKNEAPKVLPKSPIGKAINYAIDHYDRLCRYVIDGRCRIDTNLVENGQRIVALSRKNYLFCKNHDAAEDAAVMYTIMGCCKLAGVNVEAWLTYFLDHVHEYDNDYSLDIADFLPSSLVSKGLFKDIGEPPIIFRESPTSFGESPKIFEETSKSPK